MSSDFLLYFITLLLALLFSPPSSYAGFVHQKRISHSTISPTHDHQDVLVDEKARLGSSPPSCYNRCYSCNPCIAVQVPSLPIHSRSVKPGLGRFIPKSKYEQEEEEEKESLLSSASKEYTNYKPLGWKCRCGNRLFIP